MNRYDVVVVGAGSAGCVLTARLSEDSSQRVLLLEAGPDFTADSVPSHISNGRHGPGIDAATDWALKGQTRLGGRAVGLPRGKLVGGCSAMNACFALRGSPVDFDAWAAAGLDGWSFSDLLPAFTRLEHDLDFGTAGFHGDAGPIGIRRYLDDQQSAVAAATTDALTALGIERIADHNAPGAVGVGPLPVNAVDDRRISTAMAYLDPARDRHNLTVRADTLVARVLVRDGRARGVELVGGEVIDADEVIVSAGAYLSPALLWRSGIGPAADLRALGIDVVADLPGVGANLADHPALSIDLHYSAALADDARYQLVATLHSSRTDPHTDAPDLQLIAGGPFPHDDGPRCFVAAALLKPQSRGRVRLVDREAATPPVIELDYFTVDEDVDRFVEGFTLAREATEQPAMSAITGGVVSPLPTGKSEVRRHVLDGAWSYHHPVGTCSMGRDPSAGAVVDADGRVHGIDGLSVVDASIFPDIPSANTNLPVIAAAEHVAARRLASHRQDATVTA